MQTESNTCFGLVISQLGKEMSGGWAGSCSVRSQNVSGLWFDVEEETATSNDWISCNFKPFRSHTFMTTTKDDQFCDPAPAPPPSAKWTIVLLFKNNIIFRHMANFKTLSHLHSMWTSQVYGPLRVPFLF